MPKRSNVVALALPPELLHRLEVYRAEQAKQPWADKLTVQAIIRQWVEERLTKEEGF